MFRSIGGRGAAAAISVLALAVAGCGGDDEKAATEESGTSFKPAVLKITASGTAKSPIFKAPATVQAGTIEITLANNTKGDTSAQLISVEGEHSDAQVVAELGKAFQSKAVADWLKAAGGVGTTKAGQTTTVSQVLDPGRYYLVGGDEPPGGKPATFEVTGEPGGTLPKTAGDVSASEYVFGGLGLKAGKTKITLANDGREWHHFIASKLRPGATIEDAKTFLATEKGQPPFAGRENAVESTVMDGGISQVVDVELTPGKYAFFCFIADRKGGPPHVAKGMVSEVIVK